MTGILVAAFPILRIRSAFDISSRTYTTIWRRGELRQPDDPAVLKQHSRAERNTRRIGRSPHTQPPIIGKNSLKRLSHLFATDRKKFDERWEQRVDEYLKEIHRRIGEVGELWGIKDDGKRVFAVVDEALRALKSIDSQALKQKGPHTFEVLSNECCRAIGIKVIPEFLYKAKRK